MGRKGYGCSNYTIGCKFVIWKENYGRTLSDAQVHALIEKGKTGKMKLVLADGSQIQARLLIKSVETGELSYE